MEGRAQERTGLNTPVRAQQSSTTGKRLSDERLQVLERLLQIQKLTNHDIAFALECDERTVRRRRYQYQELGRLIHKHPQVAKNAEKLKPAHLDKLQEWLQDNGDVLLEDMQEFLKRECGLEVSMSTISRQLKRASGESRKRQHGAKARLKLKRERDAEGRALDYSLRRASEHDDEAASAEQDLHDLVQVPRMPVVAAATAPVVPMMHVASMVPMGPLRQMPQMMANEPIFRPIDLDE